MKILKGQISIEFMIVFAFILVVFLFLFALITQQRAITQNSQTFSQLQLVAQTIALQINRASQAGPGFSAQLPITTSIGNIPYNVSVTKAGVVIIAATSGTQIMRATAYSNVQSVSSSASFYGLGNTLYVLPIANGTISLQNSFGTICIDYQCPTNANVSGSVSLSSQVVQAAMFNGAVGGSQLTGANANSILSNTAPGFSISAWVYPTNSITSRGVTQGNSYVMRIDGPSEGSKLSWFMYIANSIEPRLSSTNPLKINNWYHVVGTYNASTGYMGLYINGALNNSETRAGSVTLGYCACFNIGVGSSSDWAGGIANFQMYGVGLSANQVKALYANGISASPINSSYLRGWWPLSGNANDYSGQGENLTSGTVLYTGVAQLFASVKNPLGQAVNNLLVGFATTFGNFSNGLGSGQAQSSYTNSKGVASLFLNQLGNNGQVLVHTTAFNSNMLPESLLAAWYPLALGQGGVAYDISGNKNSGVFAGQPGWALPNYYSLFSSPQQTGLTSSSFGVSTQTPYIEQSSGLLYMDNAAQSFSMSIWIRPNASSGIVLDELGQQQPNFNWHDSWVELVNGNAYFRVWPFSCTLLGPVNLKQWNNIALTYNGAAISGYLNGVSANSVAGTRSVPAGGTTPMFYPLGVPDVTNCGSGLSYSGGMANFQVYNSVLSQSQIRTIYDGGIAAAPNPSAGINIWYPMDGDTLDYSGNNYNGVVYGTGISFAPLLQSIGPQQISNGNGGKVLAASFNGVSSFIKVGNVTKINSLSNWSVSFWMNSTSTANYRNPLDANFVPGSNNAGPRFEQGGGGGVNSLNLIVGPGGASYNAFTYSNTIIPNVWYNVIASRNGNTIAGYLNGVMVFNGVQGLGFPSGFTNFTIGRGYANSPERWFSGNILSVQVYNQTLSSQQALRLYQEGIAGVPLPSTKLAAWLPLNGNTNNYSISSGINSIMTSNVVFNNVLNYVPYQIRSSNYSGVSFNGQSSYLNANSNGFPIGSAARSTFAWVNFNNFKSSSSTISYYGTESAAQASLLTVSSSANPVFASWANDYVSSLVIPAGSWHFVGYTYISGSKNVTIWVDGKSQTGALNGNLILNTVLSTNADIGARYDCITNGCTDINGSIANLQIYSTNLTASQVRQLYNSQIPPSASASIPLSWSP